MGAGIGPYLKRGKLIRDLVWPEITDFNKLFTFATRDEKKRPDDKQWNRADVYAADGGSMQISSYCHVSDGRNGEYHPPLYVTPSEMVRKFIRTEMVHIDHGVYFDLHIYDDGTTLVKATYQQIIGRRWLADVKTSTIKPLLKRKVK